ncbi:MAG TPA: class D sortase [Thermoanaerobaculia bacterium]
MLIIAGCALLLAAAAHYGTGVYEQALVPTDLPPGPAAPGAPIARIEIPKIGLEAAVFEGISDATLTKGPGHMPGTEMPGESSGYNNCVIAGHRDSFFRKLGWIRPGDSLRITTGSRQREYRFVRRAVVRPESTEAVGPTGTPRLTLITCYPFNWVGPAPYRLVLEARPFPVPQSGESASLAAAASRAR